MGDETLGASFSIDVTELKAGLAQANRLIRESESEFRAAAAGMDDWTKSQEGLEARQKSLNKQIDIQQEKVSALTKEKTRIIAEMKKEGKTAEEIAKATDAVNKSITQESKQLDKLKGELNKTNKALDELKNESSDAENSLDKLSDSAKDAADGFTVAKGAAAGFIANGLSELTSAAKDAISSVFNLAASTKEYRGIMASLDESSKLAGYSADETAKTYDHLYGVLGDAQKVSTTTANLQALGLQQAKLERLTNGVIGAWAKYGDSIPIDGLSEAVNHTAQLGVVQGNLADVIEWAGGTVEDFNKKLQACNSETERADLIMKMFSEQGLTDLGIAWQENNKSLVESNKAQSENERITAQWGAKIEPITTKVKDGFNRILEKLLELTNSVDMAAFGSAIDAAFDTFCDVILPAIVKGLGWIIDNKDIIIAGIVAMGAAFGAFKVASLIQSVTSALNGMTGAQHGLNAAMNANPIGLIIAAITGLIAAFATLWNNCEAFRNFWIGLWNGITDGAKKAWQGIVDTFAGLASFFGDIFGNAWEGVKNVFSTGGKIFDGIKDGILTAFKAVVNTIIKGINTVVRMPFEGLNGILNTISGLDILGVKPFGWLTWRAPVPQLPLLAQGGVVRKATTAIIGEDGAEAVVPLEKNTGWIKKLAAEIAAQQPQGVVVNQTNNYSQAHSRYEIWQSRESTAAAVKLALMGG